MSDASTPAASPRVRFAGVTAADFEELVLLRTTAMRESLERIGRFDTQRARARLQNSFHPECTAVIVCDGERIGFYTLRPLDGFFQLDHLYVAPPHQKKGVGAEVMRHVLAKAEAAGWGIKVGALRESDSNRFYRRHGFVQTTQDEWDIHYFRPRRQRT